MIILAIDPGLKGSASLFEATGQTVRLLRVMAFNITDGWESELFNWCVIFKPDVAVCEDVHAFAGQGVSSAFTFGRQLGKAEAPLTIAGVLPLQYRIPQAWQMRLGIYTGEGRKKSRKIQIARALEEFPELKAIIEGMKKVKPKAEPDIYASVLIGYSEVLAQCPEIDRAYRAKYASKAVDLTSEQLAWFQRQLESLTGHKSVLQEYPFVREYE